MNKLIIFDCDGTLVDSEVIACEVLPTYWKTHGVHFSEEEFKEKIIGTGSNAPIILEIFSKMPPHAKEEGDQLLMKAIKENLTAVNGIKELLSGLKYNVCVASNSSIAHVESALKTTKLDSFFGDNYFSADQVKNPKPAPDLFLYAADQLNFSPKNSIVIEDSVSGIKAAQSAKIPVVAFTGAKHFTQNLKNRLEKTNPDWFCSTTKELENLLHHIS